MRKSPLFILAIVVLAIVGSITGLTLAASPAHALCMTPAEEGEWVNYDSGTRSITRINVRFQCQDQVLNGRPYPPGSPYYLHLFGACHPTDCDWGEAGAERDRNNGWIRTTIHHGFATRYVWVKAYRYYGQDWLRVYIWTDFHDGRQDYASDDWFRRR